MELQHLIAGLEKLDLDFEKGEPASKDDIAETELRLGKSLPEQVRQFYSNYNGIKVDSPKFEILSLGRLHIDSGKIVFAIFDDTHRVAFKANILNSAGQWDIINADNDFLVTLTMASFWTNKIFAWLRKERAVWDVETYS